jgi:hypothetical protein
MQLQSKGSNVQKGRLGEKRHKYVFSGNLANTITGTPTEFDNPSRDSNVTNSVLASNEAKALSQFEQSLRSKE